jgi:hypothetical protein
MATKKATPENPAGITGPTKSQQRRAAQVKDIQVDVHHENVTNVPAEGVSNVLAEAPKSSREKVVSFQQVGNEAIVSVDDKEVARLDREGFAGLQRAVRSIAGSL